VDEGFVVNFLVERVLMYDPPAQDEYPKKFSDEPYGPPLADRVENLAHRLYIPYLPNVDLWMNTITEDTWVALVPTDPGKLSVVTTGGAVEVADDPYWMFVRHETICPILSAHGVALTHDQLKWHRGYLLFFKKQEFVFVGYHFDVVRFLMQRSGFHNARGFPPRAGQPTNMKMHLAAFDEELNRVYGGAAAGPAERGILMGYLNHPRMIAMVGRN
jgi:hypothetical protein